MSLSQPYIIPINNRGQFELMTDYAYSWNEDSKDCRYTVRKGFITDKASTPRFSWMLGFLPDGLWDAAATIHDRLYQIEGMQAVSDEDSLYEEFDPPIHQWQAKARKFTRKECDLLFLRIMQDAGVSPWRAKLMYWAVATFGSLAW